jgi:feruloyl-CoA synthase
MASFFDDPTQLAPQGTLCERRPDGTLLLRSPEPLGDYARCIGEWIEQWAVETPDALALAERDATAHEGGDWRRVTYLELRAAIGSIGQALLDLDLPAGGPVVVLSDNAVDHALLALAAMHVGRPVCTVSSAYSRLTKDHTKLRGILQALQPALVYAADAAVYGPAIAACDVDAPVVFSRGAAGVLGAIDFGTLLSATETSAVQRAFDAIRPDDHAKYLLTSGSTGHPKVVINTHRMLCANQQMIAQTWRFLSRTKPVLLDWLPWSHTFGANHNLHLVLKHGGSLYIDEGRPAPGLIEKTVRNLRDVKPTLHFNVPRGLDMLLPHLETDLDLAREALSNLQLIFYAGAALPPASWQRLEALAAKVRDTPLWLTTSWGATETSPSATSAHWKLEGAGCIGAPLPGVDLKLVPNGEKLEIRVRGVSVFPGYRNAPELTREAFDDEGYYRIGDAGYLVDPEHPERGVMFNGRVAEDFKLGSGTWVSVGTLRVKLVSAFAPYVQDVVLTGHGGDELGALVFPSAAAAAAEPQAVRRAIAAALQRLRAEGGGSSHCPARVMLLTEPPSADAGEITDKGYVNQRAVLARRAAEVQRLHARPDDPRVIT